MTMFRNRIVSSLWRQVCQSSNRSLATKLPETCHMIFLPLCMETTDGVRIQVVMPREHGVPYGKESREQFFTIEQKMPVLRAVHSCVFGTCSRQSMDLQSSTLLSNSVCALGSQNYVPSRTRMRVHYQPSAWKRIHRHGMDKRIASRGGIEILWRRFLKGRHVLTVYDKLLRRVSKKSKQRF